MPLTIRMRCSWQYILRRLAGVFGFAVAVAAPARPPNIIVLFADDLGWLDVSYQGERHQTPQIDTWARRGMIFSQAYAASPTCSPSRAALVTGQHPARLKIVRHIPGGRLSGADRFGRTHQEFNILPEDPAKMPSRNWLPLGPETIASALKPRNYRSIFLGKWHLGDERYHPDKHGFDEQIGTSNFGQPGSYYAPYWPGRSEAYADVPKGKYLTDQQTDDAVAYIERQDGERPFLLSLFYYAVHTPHEGRADLTAAAEARGLRGPAAHYAAMVQSLDQSVGRIRAALERRGLARDTLVVFTSDQGSYFGAEPRFRGGKVGGTALYEGGSRVPLFIVWPGVVDPGSRCDEPVILTDVFPTLVEAAGGDAQTFPHLDGLSLLPILQRRGSLQRDAIYLYRSYGDQYAAVRSREWKLIAYRTGQTELFDLKHDEAETRDLSQTRPEIAAELKTSLLRWEKNVGVHSPLAVDQAGPAPQ